MIQIQIGTAERSLNDASESWINEQINRRKADGLTVCIRVKLKTDGLFMVLTTPSCSQGGGDRSPNHRESAVLDLWDKMHMNSDNFASGNLVAFLKQVQSYI